MLHLQVKVREDYPGQGVQQDRAKWVHTASQVLPPLAIEPCPPQSWGQVFCEAVHQLDFWSLGMVLAGTWQHAPMDGGRSLMEAFWAAAKPERAAEATRRVA